MAETYKKLENGLLETRKTPDEIISTQSQKEIEGKIAEEQTKIDHLNIDLAAAEREKAVWVSKLEIIKEVKAIS